MRDSDIIRRLDALEKRVAKLEKTKEPLIQKKKSTKKKEEIEDVGYNS